VSNIISSCSVDIFPAGSFAIEIADNLPSARVDTSTPVAVKCPFASTVTFVGSVTSIVTLCPFASVTINEVSVAVGSIVPVIVEWCDSTALITSSLSAVFPSVISIVLASILVSIVTGKSPDGTGVAPGACGGTDSTCRLCTAS